MRIQYCQILGIKMKNMIVLLKLVCKHSSKTINFVVYNNIPSVVYFFLSLLHWKNQGIFCF